MLQYQNMFKTLEESTPKHFTSQELSHCFVIISKMKASFRRYALYLYRSARNKWYIVPLSYSDELDSFIALQVLNSIFWKGFAKSCGQVWMTKSRCSMLSYCSMKCSVWRLPKFFKRLKILEFLVDLILADTILCTILWRLRIVSNIVILDELLGCEANCAWRWLYQVRTPYPAFHMDWNLYHHSHL